MRKTYAFLLLIVVITFLLAFPSACGGKAEDPPAKTVTKVSVDEEVADTRVEAVELAIERERERLHGIEGREGILAEQRRYSLFDEELIIRDFFQDRREGFFVDVGCAWPVLANNTYYLEKDLGWTGFGIDALAEYGLAWREKRPNSRFFSYLVTDHSAVAETFFRSPSTGLSSTSRARASGKIFGAELEPEEVQVEAITLDDLLTTEGVTKIDLLAMDIEGHEREALAGFDIERFQPKLVVIEGPAKFARGDGDWIYRYFERHGYQLIEEYRPFDKVNSYFKPKEP